MPEVSIPLEAIESIVGVESHLVHDAQIELTSPWTNTRQVLDRGYPRWEGTLALEAADDEATGRIIEAWVNSFHGLGNFCEIPLMRPTAQGFAVDVASSQIDPAGHLSHVVDADPIGLEVGMRVRSGVYVFSVRSIDARTLILDPQRPLAAAATIGPASTVRAFALASTAAVQPRSGDFWGPWAFNWREE